MRFRPARLRSAELLSGLAAAVLLVALFAVKWYAVGGAAPGGLVAVSVDGWHSFSVLRWAILLTALLGIALVLAEAGFRAPAIPVTLAVILSAVGVITAVWLAVRLIFAGPARGGAALGHRGGGWLALGAVLGLVAASVASLRTEGLREADGPGEIETVLPSAPRAG